MIKRILTLWTIAVLTMIPWSPPRAQPPQGGGATTPHNPPGVVVAPKGAPKKNTAKKSNPPCTRPAKCPPCPASSAPREKESGEDDELFASTKPRRHKLLVIEKIIVSGNRKAKRSFVLGLLPFKRGTYLSPDDRRLFQARLRLLSLGLFQAVDFSFAKGSTRGKVVLHIQVTERGTLLIKHLFGGTSKIIPFWAGIGLEERNFLGRGLTLGLSAVGTAKPEIMGGREQFAAEAYMLLPATFKLPIALGAHFNQGSEFYRLYGESDSGDPSNFLSMQYRTFGWKLKTWFALGNLFLHTGLDTNIINASIPNEAVRYLPDGRTKNVDFELASGLSAISVLFMKLVYDSRNRPLLPSKGMLIELLGRLSSPLTGSHYSYLKGEIHASKFMGWGNHVLSFHFYGASIMGSPPLFEKIYIGDIQDLIPQRALGLNLSVAPSPNPFGTGISDMRWGTAAMKLTSRYDYSFYEGRDFVYRANFFVSGGVIMLSTATGLRLREGGLWESLPMDITLNFGVHLDTKVGVFRLSFSNIIGRLPL